MGQVPAHFPFGLLFLLLCIPKVSIGRTATVTLQDIAVTFLRREQPWFLLLSADRQAAIKDIALTGHTNLLLDDDSILSVDANYQQEEDSVWHGNNKMHSRRAHPNQIVGSQYNTVIVGAGLGGLTTARELLKKGISGSDILVVESRGRVGGRIRNIPIRTVTQTTNAQRPFVLEGGATWIGPTQEEINNLIQELNLGTYSSYYYPLTTPDQRFTADMLPIIQRIEALADTVNLEEPWLTENATRLDARHYLEYITDQLNISFNEIDATITPGGTSYNATKRRQFSALYTDLMALVGLPEDVSLLWALWWIKSVHGIALVTGYAGGAQDKRLIEGTQMIPIRLAQALSTAGVTISLNTSLTAITETTNKKSVLTFFNANNNSNITTMATNVVLAIGVGERMGISLSPPWTSAHAEFARLFPRSTTIKAFLVYERPFWRADPFKSDIPFTVANSLLPVFDLSPYQEETTQQIPGVLGVFLTPQPNETLSDRRITLTSILEARFANMVIGADNISTPTPLEYIEITWSVEEGTWNCFGALGRRVITQYAANGWRAAAGNGNIHFAGSAYAAQHWGYMDAAVRSARSVANDVVAFNSGLLSGVVSERSISNTDEDDQTGEHSDADVSDPIQSDDQESDITNGINDILSDDDSASSESGDGDSDDDASSAVPVIVILGLFLVVCLLCGTIWFMGRRPNRFPLATGQGQTVEIADVHASGFGAQLSYFNSQGPHPSVLNSYGNTLPIAYNGNARGSVHSCESSLDYYAE